MCDPSIRDNGQCNHGTPDCRKTCGVSAMATKPCGCNNGQWNCGTCVYPPGDYACYQLPPFGVPSCPFGTMNGVTSCAGTCTLCSGYADSTGASKIGYCTCGDAEDEGPSVYRCASSAEWPPQ